MLTYALVGLGGAVGSILRAWLGTAMIVLTGPTFPWGTILINIVGSFVIGFFGMLTATDGRFAATADLRAFVMVGVCGGFTTFSSFSLQTLDLIRDGRPLQALANVAVSVLLCLASVTAGYSSAWLVRTSGPITLSAAGPSSLGNRTLVAIHRPEAVRPMLDMAARLMEREDVRTTALAIDGPALAGIQPTEEILTQERKRELSEARNNWVQSVRPVLDEWVEHERADGHRARWVEIKGDGARAIVEHGRGAHLLLLEHQPDDPGNLERIRSALVHASRPLLLVPSTTTHGEVGRIVAIAWRDDAQARHAVQCAMPILKRAEQIVVLHVGSADHADDKPVDVLDSLPVKMRMIPDSGEGVGEQLLKMAGEARADLLVMGSYDRGETYEALFDGVTESILRAAELPVLMQPKAA